MRISMEADYALRIIHLLSVNEKQQYDTNEIAEALYITPGFVKKILCKLNKAHLTRSYRGRCGGYALLEDKSKISMRKVIELIDGPLIINVCLKDDGKCTRGAREACPMYKELIDLSKMVTEKLESVTFNNLVK